jgi:hypothetical protein
MLLVSDEQLLGLLGDVSGGGICDVRDVASPGGAVAAGTVLCWGLLLCWLMSSTGGAVVSGTVLFLFPLWLPGGGGGVGGLDREGGGELLPTGGWPSASTSMLPSSSASSSSSLAGEISSSLVLSLSLSGLYRLLPVINIHLIILYSKIVIKFTIFINQAPLSILQEVAKNQLLQRV